MSTLGHKYYDQRRNKGVIVWKIGLTKLYSDVSSQICNIECNTSVDRVKPASHISLTISSATCTCITNQQEFILNAN